MTRRRGRGGSAPSIFTAPLVLAAGVTLVVVASRAGASGSDAALCPAARSGSPAAAGMTLDGQPLSVAQIGNARLIYDVAASRRLPQRAAVIAIATAMQESRLRNLPDGTADSLGLFQQRPSRGWGTPSEVMRPGSAAVSFYSRLTRIPGWRTLPLTVAAQDVQRSAYPDAYARWEPLATDVTAGFSGCG